MEKYLTVYLEKLRFRSRIGVFDFEREEDNDFEVNIEIKFDASEFQSEELKSTISYADIYNEVRTIMSKEWLLLETVAIEIAETIIKMSSNIKEGEVSVTKVNPPIEGIQGSCGARYSFVL